MQLVRYMFYICALNSIECKAAHVATSDNGIADSLFRLDFIRFGLLTTEVATCQVNAFLPDCDLV